MKRAHAVARIINVCAPYDTAKLFQGSLRTPLHHHRGAFYEWSGAAWLGTDEAALRARLYRFLDQCRRELPIGGLCPVKPNVPMVRGLLDALRAVAYLDEKVEPPHGSTARTVRRRMRSSRAPTVCCTCRPCGSCRIRRHFSLTTRSTLLTIQPPPSRGNGSPFWARSGPPIRRRSPRCKRCSAIA